MHVQHPLGRYRYMHLPFGIKMGDDILIQEMNRLMGDLKGVGIITYDIIVYCRTVYEHNEHLRVVLKCMLKVNFKLNTNKQEYAKPLSNRPMQVIC